MSELHTLVLVEDDGPTMVDPRFEGRRETARADPVDPNRKARAWVALALGAALFASGVTAYRQHRRADRLAAELAARSHIDSVCAPPGTESVYHGTGPRLTPAQANTPSMSSGGRRDVRAINTARLEALAARHVVLGDYRSALDQYRALAEGPTNPSAFADLVAVLEREVGCIETGEFGGRRCD